MQSEIPGAIETAVQPTIAQFRAAYLAGVTMTLTPDACQATAQMIEHLAQITDNETAITANGRQLRTEILKMLAVVVAIIFVAIVS